MTTLEYLRSLIETFKQAQGTNPEIERFEQAVSEVEPYLTNSVQTPQS